MGPDSPTSFRPGDLTNQEMQLQADFFYDPTDAISLVFGASYLDETYKVVQGELSSYFAGPYATPDPWGFCDDDGAATAAGLAVLPVAQRWTVQTRLIRSIEWLVSAQTAFLAIHLHFLKSTTVTLWGSTLS